MPRTDAPLPRRFFYNMLDAGNCEINLLPLEVDARDLGHAMQKIAAALADDCVEVQVWRAGTRDPNDKSQKDE